MKRKLYGNNIQPSCEHCANGKRSSVGRPCSVRGVAVMPLYHSCRHFEYDRLNGSLSANRRFPGMRKRILP